MRCFPDILKKSVLDIIPWHLSFVNFANIGQQLTHLCFHMIPNIFPIFSACERLILLKNDANELRDYSILLYHCGLYEQSLEYLKKYRELKVLFRSYENACDLLFKVNLLRCFHIQLLQNSSTQETLSPNSLSSLEEDAVNNLMMRLNLVLMEQGWTRPSYARNFFGNNSEPW